MTLVGGVSDEALDDEYWRAHVLVLPSYHEGFCKPVIEALRFGCIPVTYNSSNLKYVAHGLSRTVPAGHAGALAAGIAEAARSVNAVYENPEAARIAVDRGTMSLTEYERAVDDVIASSGFPSVSSQLRRAARSWSWGAVGRSGWIREQQEWWVLTVGSARWASRTANCTNLYRAMACGCRALITLPVVIGEPANYSQLVQSWSGLAVRLAMRERAAFVDRPLPALGTQRVSWLSPLPQGGRRVPARGIR